MSDKISVERCSEGLYSEIASSLSRIQECWPQYNIEGYRNIWIVKPGALSRGRGKVKFFFLYLATRIYIMYIKISILLFVLMKGLLYSTKSRTF